MMMIMGDSESHGVALNQSAANHAFFKVFSNYDFHNLLFFFFFFFLNYIKLCLDFTDDEEGR